MLKQVYRNVHLEVKKCLFSFPRCWFIWNELFFHLQSMLNSDHIFECILAIQWIYQRTCCVYKIEVGRETSAEEVVNQPVMYISINNGDKKYLN